ncbi:MAG TPA: right-handed parallel beta-helix repeat-containing protein [archaeon]|nr:right-handed parallel beta-helix repeat-containing protein [archaeon]
MRTRVLVLLAGWLLFSSTFDLPFYGKALASDNNPHAVATFECLGIYYKVDNDSLGECRVRYRKSGTSQWKEGLPLWFDKRDSEYRGSLVGLAPGTEYEIGLDCAGKEVVFEARTRSDKFPVGKKTLLKGGVTDEIIHITGSGSPEAWHLVAPEPGARTVIDPEKTTDYNIIIEASYVIIRGLELRNARTDAILIKEGVHDVVVEDCHITLWGRGDRELAYLGYEDSGIAAENGAARLVIQRNLIDNPSGWTNDWDTGHPSGPQGITLWNTGGGNIIRYNEIQSTEDHGFNDGIGGGSNYSFQGSPNRDSDIYGNIIANVWDDAIESEGANMNVRIWGNYIHHTFTHIATAVTSKGPLYIFRNVFGLSRRTHQDPLGGPMIKTGEREPFAGGRRYVFHNTALQPKGAFRVFSSHPVSNTVSRNNIFDCPGPLAGRRTPDPPADLDYDLFTGLDTGPDYEKHSLGVKPSFVPSQGLEFYLAPSTTRVKWGRTEVEHYGKKWTITDKVITIDNPAIDAGVPVPGFNNDYQGQGPDLGAFELGSAPLRFGRHAVEPVVYAPWEVR